MTDLNALMTTTVVQALGPEVREKLIADAVAEILRTELFKPVEPTYSRGDTRSAAQRELQGIVWREIGSIMREEMEKPEIREELAGACRKVIAQIATDKMVEAAKNGLEEAMTKAFRDW